MSRTCGGRLFQKLAPETAWKSPFADDGEVERQYSKLVGGSRPESLPRWHVSDTGEVWRQIRWCTAGQSSEDKRSQLIAVYGSETWTLRNTVCLLAWLSYLLTYLFIYLMKLAMIVTQWIIVLCIFPCSSTMAKHHQQIYWTFHAAE